MIEAIVFDLWNCLARNTREPGPMRSLAEGLGITTEPGWRKRIERGMMLVPASGIEGALRQIQAREGLRIADYARRLQVIERWQRAAADVEIFPDALPALAALRPRYALGLCSNTQSFGLEFLDRAGLWRFFDASALSFEVGALKPHPVIFRTVCQRLGVSADRTLMVGDQPDDDITGARAAGLHAVLLDRAPSSPPEPATTSHEPCVIHTLADLPAYVDSLDRASA